MAQHRETSKHLEAFEAWYAAGRSCRNLPNLAVPERTLREWAKWFNWHERADARDEEAKRIADAEAARERATRQKRRRQAGELLTARGMEYFKDSKIDSPRDAIQAIKTGIEIERKEDGVPDWVLMILNADPNELEKLAGDFAHLASGAAEAGGGDDSDAPDFDAENE